MNERWMWTLRYGVVIALALVLGAALGEMDLFKASRLGKTGLNASHIARFLGFGGALLALWLLARRTASLLATQGERANLVAQCLLPLTTLIVVASTHAVLLLVLKPLMGRGMLQAYNWVFIAAIILSAAWLVMALFTGTASLSKILGVGPRSLRHR
jgi:hypothetical protein